MSLFYDYSNSKYLVETTKSLSNRKNLSDEERFACNPRPKFDDNQTLTFQSENIYFDSRNEKELRRCINHKKIGQSIMFSGAHRSSNLWFVIATGSFFPLHNSHIDMMNKAIQELTDETRDNVALMGYFIPNNIEYTRSKLKKRGIVEYPDYMSNKNAFECIQLALNDEQKMDVCSIDFDRKSYCEWYVCAKELIELIHDYFKNCLNSIFDYEFIKPRLKFAFVGGEDFIRSPSRLYKGVECVDFLDKILVVPRDINEEKREKYRLSEDIVVLDHYDKSISSTKVRKLIENKDVDELKRILHHRTFEYLQCFIN